MLLAYINIVIVNISLKSFLVNVFTLIPLIVKI